MRYASAIAATLLSMYGCAQLSPRPPLTAWEPPYSAEEHEPYRADGSASITGQAFLRQRGGGVVTCAGEKVMVMPDTQYFRETLLQLKAGAVPSAGQDVWKGAGLVRRTQCDAQGNFTVTKLPAGNWLVVTAVLWTVGYRQQGGIVSTSVPVKANQAAQVLLSDESRN